MALSVAERRVLIACGVVAIAWPVLALYPYARTPRPVDATVAAPIASNALPPVSRVFDRTLFAPAEAEAAPADAPMLTGIAGRLNRDAVALVRLADGSARTLAVGESVDGWRLESLAIDAAFFTRGRERVRVAMQDEPPPAE